MSTVAAGPLASGTAVPVGTQGTDAAREVLVSMMGTIYGVAGEGDQQSQALGERLRAERDLRTGRPTYTPLIAVGLLVFYVFAMMCRSESAILAREAGGSP